MRQPNHRVLRVALTLADLDAAPNASAGCI
jgi:hypothetical protein